MNASLHLPAAGQALRAAPVATDAPTGPDVMAGVGPGTGTDCSPILYDCAPPTSTTGNLLSNADFETIINCRCPQPRNMANLTTTKLCSWTDANNTRSDVYAACATGSTNASVYYYGVPNNFWGTQAPRSGGNAYIGVLAHSPGGNTGSRRSYANTMLAAPLVAGRTYYAEYYASLAESAQLRVGSLGFAATVGYPGEITDGLFSNFSGISDPTANLSDRTGWQPVRTTFVAGGGENSITLGYFDPTPVTALVPGAAASPYGVQPGAFAYYYLDDALLMAVPRAGASFATTNCGTPTALPVDGLALPASAGATYRWTSSTDPSFVATTLNVSVSSSVTATYTLTVTIPGQIQSVTSSSVTMFVNCCYNAQTPGIVSIQGTRFASSFQFAAGLRYFVSGNLILLAGAFTIPAGCTLNVAAGAKIQLSTATLTLAGGTITAACGQMWDGVYVGGGDNFVSQAGGSPVRNAEISYALAGVVYTDAGPNANATPFAVTNTNFLHNYESLNLRDLTRTGTVSNCLFDSDPTAMLAPYARVSATSYTHAMRHVVSTNAANASANNTRVVVSGNTFRRAMFGVWTGTGAPSPVLRGNQFTGLFVAGAYSGASPYFGAVEMSANVFRLPTEAVNTDNPPQLNQAYALAPGSDRQEAYGVLAGAEGAYQPIGNQFVGPNRLSYGDARPTYRQVGFSASAPPGYGQMAFPDNNFRDLYEGMRLQLKTGSFITGNVFRRCVYGLHLMGPGSGGPPNILQVQCNTFITGLEFFGTANFTRGIFVDANYPVQLTGRIGGSGAVALLKNRFLHDGPYTSALPYTDVWNHPSNPAFVYNTFDCVLNGNTSPFYDPLVVRNVNALATGGPSLVPIAGPSGNGCPHDGYPNAGVRARGVAPTPLQPVGGSVTTLETASPNPAQDQATIGYKVASTDVAHDLTLVVRSLLSGAVVREVKLDPRRNSVTVPVAALPEGVYVYSLLVNGRPAATHRLMVSR